jgi:hypothetical protein
MDSAAAPVARHLDTEALERGLDSVRSAPRDVGTVDLIVRRPVEDRREVLEVGELDLTVGLVGDDWSRRPSARTDDGAPHPDMQLNVMNSRVTALVAGQRDRWPLAGDQLYLDLDLSVDNLPAGTRLALGTAVIEITDQPHLGCAKFTRRFGLDAHRWVNSEHGKRLRLRGACAKVVQPGTVRAGDAVTKLVD